MANRFNQILPTQYQYIPQYIPMPLSEISDLAKDYSTKYRTGKALPNKLALIDQAVQAAPMNYDLKQQFLQKAQERISALTDGKNVDYASPEYQEKVNFELNQIANDPILNVIKTNKERYDKHKLDNPLDLDHTYNKVPTSIHHTGYEQDITGKIFEPKITKYVDPQDIRKELMSNIPADSEKGGYWDFNNKRVINNGETQVYNKTTNEYETVSYDKIDKIAEVVTPLYANSPAGLYKLRKALLNELGPDVQNMDYNTLQQLSEQDGSGKAMKIFNEVTSMFKDDLLREGFKQGYTKKSTDVSITKETDNAAKALNELQRTTPALNDLVENPELVNLTDPLLSKLKGLNVVGEDGTIDYSKLTKNSRSITGTMGAPMYASGNNLKVTNTNINENQQDLVKLITTASKALGITMKDISPEKYPEIINRYTDLMKSRVYATDLQPAEQNLFSNDIVEHPSGYTFVNGKGEVQKERPNLLNKEVKATERVSMNGKSYIKTELVDKENGEIEVLYARSEGKKYNKHFDVIASVSKENTDYITTGKKTIKPEEIVKYNTGQPFTVKTENGELVQIAKTKGNNPYESIITFANPNNRGESLIFKYIALPNQMPELVNMGPFTDFMPNYENSFYKTTEGTAYLQNLETDAKKAKNKKEESE